MTLGAHLEPPAEAGTVDGRHDGLGRLLDLLKHLLALLGEPGHLLCGGAGLDHTAHGRRVAALSHDITSNLTLF